MARKQITLQQINTLNQVEFVQQLGALFEDSPWIAAAAWHAQPFASRAALYSTLCSIMSTAPIEQQIELLQAHPDLVGRAALAGTLSSASTNEQASAGLDRLTPQEIALFTQYNQTYRKRFGFPFVICVRANKKTSILAGFEARLGNTRSQEIQTALGEVAKICSFRLYDLVNDDDTSQHFQPPVS